MDVLVDASFIIDLAKAGGLGIFGKVTVATFHVTDSVEHEVSEPSQAAMLEAEISKGSIKRIRLEEMADLALYARLRDRFGEGESSCIALARARGWHVAISETNRRFMKMVQRFFDARMLLRTTDLPTLGCRSASRPPKTGSRPVRPNRTSVPAPRRATP